MNRPKQGQRIVVLVRALVGLGLLMVGITIGLIGWTLTRVRAERALATAEQEQLKRASDQLRQRAVESRVELQAVLDETRPFTNRVHAIPRLMEFILSQPEHALPGIRPASEQFTPLIPQLAAAVQHGSEWRASYDPVWQDVSQQRTLGEARALITQLRGAVEALEGRRRLDDAIKHRRWRMATNDASLRLARAILEEQGREQSQGVNDFKGELAECARLVELLGGEEQIDSLADLKDNKLKPVLDRLSRNIAAFGAASTNAGPLTPQSIEQLNAVLFGAGPDGGGLFKLRHDALRLRREREKMKLELAALFHDIETANAGFAQSAQARTAALTQQMEGSLAAGWKQMLYVGGGCSALFLWLAWMISRGIGGQVRAIDRARAEAVQENAERRQAEEALRKNEAQLQTIVENLAEGVAVSDLDGRLLHFNRAALAMHGFASVEETRRHMSEFADVFKLSDMNDAALTVEQWPLSRILRGESLRDLDVRLRRSDAGWERVFSFGGSLVHDADGKPLMAVVTISDITERKRTETMLAGERRALELMASGAALPSVLELVARNIEGQSDGLLCSILLLDDSGKHLLHGAAPSLPEAYNRAIHGVTIGPGVGSCGTAAFRKETVIVCDIAADPLWRDFQELALAHGLRACWSKPIISAAGKVLGTFALYFRTARSPSTSELELIERAAHQAGIAIERKAAESELVRTHKELLETSRMAGMAEVATGVLHNVGNVLNSVNVSATLVADKVKKSKIASLTKVVAMLREHEADIGAFISADPKGKQIPSFLGTLAESLGTEQATVLQEVENLQKNIEHIKDVVAMQQTYAKISGVAEAVDLGELMEDTLRMNASSLTRHDIEVVREFAAVPPVTVDKHKLLQILVNLVRNAKHACDDSGRTDKRIILRVTGDGANVRISVSDNGVGIPAENLTRIFNHGFTTKKDGHGFGLHSSANAAREMDGSLTVHSEGPGQGATFTVELPVQSGGRSATPAKPAAVANVLAP